jgi:hypothetical protein
MGRPMRWRRLSAVIIPHRHHHQPGSFDRHAADSAQGASTSFWPNSRNDIEACNSGRSGATDAACSLPARHLPKPDLATPYPTPSRRIITPTPSPFVSCATSSESAVRSLRMPSPRWNRASLHRWSAGPTARRKDRQRLSPEAPARSAAAHRSRPGIAAAQPLGRSHCQRKEVAAPVSRTALPSLRVDIETDCFDAFGAQMLSDKIAGQRLANAALGVHKEVDLRSADKCIEHRRNSTRSAL